MYEQLEVNKWSEWVWESSQAVLSPSFRWKDFTAWQFYEPFSLHDPAGQAIKIPFHSVTSDKQLESHHSISCDITNINIRYSFNLYYIKVKDMVLSHSLSRQKHDNSNPHEIIPISFNMYSILQEKYYNIGNSERYLGQTQSQAKSSGIKLPEVHSVSKSLDPNIQPEKQVAKPLVKEISQVKSRIGQGRAGSRWKKPPINHPIAQSAENTQKFLSYQKYTQKS